MGHENDGREHMLSALEAKWALGYVDGLEDGSKRVAELEAEIAEMEEADSANCEHKLVPLRAENERLRASESAARGRIAEHEEAAEHMADVHGAVLQDCALLRAENERLQQRVQMLGESLELREHLLTEVSRWVGSSPAQTFPAGLRDRIRVALQRWGGR